MNDLKTTANELVESEEEIRAIFLDCFAVNEEGNSKDYEAVAGIAVDCAVRIYNILQVAKTKGNSHRAILDLTVGLHGNPFWTKHAISLVPLLHVAIVAQTDKVLLLLEQQENPKFTKYDKLIGECSLVGVEVFSMMLYALGGSELMTMKSLELKRRLMPYMV